MAHMDMHVPIGNMCPASSLNGPVNSELKLPNTNWAGARGICVGPEAPPDLATDNSLVLKSPQLETLTNFLWRTCSSDYKTDQIQPVFRKVSDATSACLIFIYCQLAPLAQFLLQTILQDSGSKLKPKWVTFHGQLCTDAPLCIFPCLSNSHISMVAAYGLCLSEYTRKRNSVPDSHQQASPSWDSELF